MKCAVSIIFMLPAARRRSWIGSRGACRAQPDQNVLKVLELNLLYCGLDLAYFRSGKVSHVLREQPQVLLAIDLFAICLDGGHCISRLRELYDLSRTVCGVRSLPSWIPVVLHCNRQPDQNVLLPAAMCHTALDLTCSWRTIHDASDWHGSQLVHGQ